jgi:hypothetical protein
MQARGVEAVAAHHLVDECIDLRVVRVALRNDFFFEGLALRRRLLRLGLRDEHAGGLRRLRLRVRGRDRGRGGERSGDEWSANVQQRGEKGGGLAGIHVEAGGQGGGVRCRYPTHPRAGRGGAALW